MENQEKRISRSGISFVMFIILLGWLLDVLSTFVGMGIRVHVPGGYYYLFELSPFFMLFPAGWGVMLLCLAAGIYLFSKIPYWIKGCALLWVIALSLLPSIRNTVIILGLVFQ